MGMKTCPYCSKPVDEHEIAPSWDSDPHGNPMCVDCSILEEMQWKMCYRCNEYGLAQRKSGVFICVDCGDMPDELGERRVASSADF